MIIQALAFYLFAFVAVASGVMVISARNPVHSVLYLILAFFNAAGLFVLMGAEFLAMILVVVYVGAVAVLFLFVVMMLDINFTEMRKGFMQNLPVGALVGIILAVELILIFGSWAIAPEAASVAGSVTPDGVSNTQALGRIMYTDYIYLFQTAGMILLYNGKVITAYYHTASGGATESSEYVWPTSAGKPGSVVPYIRGKLDVDENGVAYDQSYGKFAYQSAPFTMAELSDRAKRFALNRQLASSAEETVTTEDFATALQKVRPSITSEVLKQFEAWRNAKSAPTNADDGDD